ncbi:MAG: energy transducer TonB [bacterium]|nr:energy transducer TonB [bacterium]
MTQYPFIRLAALACGLLAGPAAWATSVDCAAYAEGGVSVGMNASDVRQRMGRANDQSIRSNGEMDSTSDRYLTDAGELYVEYDGVVSRKTEHSSRVVLVRRTTDDEGLAAFSAELAERFGRSPHGSPEFQAMLRRGSLEWIDTACATGVRVYRRDAPWWAPSDGPLTHLEIRALDTGSAPGPRPPAALAAAEVDRTAPVRLFAFPADYPPKARNFGRLRVVVEATVRVDGTIADPVVVRGPFGKAFRRAAVEAVTRWRYEPATLAGRPVEQRIVIPVDFDPAAAGGANDPSSSRQLAEASPQESTGKSR